MMGLCLEKTQIVSFSKILCLLAECWLRRRVGGRHSAPVLFGIALRLVRVVGFQAEPVSPCTVTPK